MKRLLIVDDNEHQHELFRVYAMMIPELKLDHANNLEDAVSSLKENDYDLMFLDNRLHPHESYKDCVPIIWDNNYKGKIVVVSSDVDQKTACQISEFKVTDFIDKSSISIHDFKQIVHNYI